MKIRPTRILVWLIVAAAAAGFYFAFQPQPQEADFGQAARGRLIVTLDEEGETRVRDRYVVSAPLLGKVLRIELEPGDRVQAGSTVLARFQPTDPEFLDERALAEAEANVKTSEAAVNRTRVDLSRALAEEEHATSELRRYQRLHQDGLLADDRMEAVRLRKQTADETVRAAESSIAVAQAELERSRTALIRVDAARHEQRAIDLKSPINGVVLRRLRESTSVVPAGEPLLEIADPEKLEIVSDMLSTDAVRIRPGHQVLIEQWGGDRTLTGRVRKVEPFGFTKISALGVEEQRVNVIVDFEDVREAWEALGDGYRVEIRVVIWEEDDVLKIPSSSLFRHGEKWAVYTVDSLSLATLQEVEVGQRNAREAQVLKGLAEGDQVIAYPNDQIEAGVEVTPRGR
ncbi:MAG: HlyD family efflux transporter periplasmic adaptor subunit [Bryobacterales bacterium]|nr:HlyD family efflux transporter periplasmic adaptor subunit [Bryobacterales bacterium]